MSDNSDNSNFSPLTNTNWAQYVSKNYKTNSNITFDWFTITPVNLNILVWHELQPCWRFCYMDRWRNMDWSNDISHLYQVLWSSKQQTNLLLWPGYKITGQGWIIKPGQLWMSCLNESIEIFQKLIITHLTVNWNKIAVHIAHVNIIWLVDAHLLQNVLKTK